MSWELFEHTADLGLRVRAPTLEALFEQAGEGLFAMIAEPVAGRAATGDDSVGGRGEHAAGPDDTGERQAGGEPVELRIDGARREWLFHDWLAELLYVFESRGLLLADFHVAFDATGLDGRATGRSFDPAFHRALHEVKAITYHGLEVEATDDGWTAQVIVDI